MARKAKEKKISFFTKGSIDYIILIIVLLLLSVGLIMVLSASSPSSLSESGNSYKYFSKQLKATGIGLLFMVAISRIDYRIYKKFRWLIYAIATVILIIVGVARRRSRRC